MNCTVPNTMDFKVTPVEASMSKTPMSNLIVTYGCQMKTKIDLLGSSFPNPEEP